jgi:hypothetical protein
MKIAITIVRTTFAVVASALVLSCGGGGKSNSTNDASGSGSTAAKRDVNISCGAGAGEATLDATTTPGFVTATATLTGNQQSPPVCTGAKGTGTLTVDTTTGNITGSITLDSISNVTMAHIHDAEANDAIIVPLVQNGSNPLRWDVQSPNNTLSPDQITHFNNGSLYFNAHTTANSKGEVRGQIGRSIFTAVLTSAQERLSDPSAAASTATGTGKVVLDPSANTMTATFTVTGLSGASTAAHIHTGAVGAAPGPVTFSMDETSAGSGVFTTAQPLDAQQLSDLRAGNMYFNVHTDNNPNGEIRGQIGRVVRVAQPFGGAAQVPAVKSRGSGSGFAVLDIVARSFNGSMTIKDITPTMSHIHEGATGVNGSIVVNFTPPTSTTPTATSQLVNATVVKEFLDDATYMNAHTAANTGGEIRGQLDIP